MFNSIHNDRLASRSPMFNSTLASQGGRNNGYPFPQPFASMFEPQLPQWAVDDPQLNATLQSMGFITGGTSPPGATNNPNASDTAGGESSTGMAGMAGVALDEETHQSSTEVRAGNWATSHREFYSRRSATVFVSHPSPATANGKQGATSPKGDKEQGVPTDGDEQRVLTEQELQELASKFEKYTSRLERIVNFIGDRVERKMLKKMRADKF